MKIFKAAALAAVSVIFAVLLCLTASAESIIPYENYTYSEIDMSMVPGPQAYVPSALIYGKDIGVGDFSAPSDIEAGPDGLIYVLDTGNNRVAVINSDLSSKAVFICYDGGKNGKLADASGIFVDDSYIYIADTGNHQILIMDKNTGAQVKIVTAPKAELLGEDFIFNPIRLAADSERLLYVVGEGTYEGIININWDSEFIGFIGSSNVTASAWDIFWQRFSTKEQRKNRVQFIPQDHSSIDIDSEGFYYCTMYTQKDNRMVKRLNPGGADVIRDISNVPIIGDPKNYLNGALKGYSSFSDVSCGNYKIYACLDYTRKKIFCYNHDGYLLYTFGDSSSQMGGFSQPVGITWISDDRMAVIDEHYGSITVFSPTDYAKAIHEGLDAQNKLDYSTADKCWENVLKMNSNFELAKNEVGKVYLANKEYKKAMEEFKAANNMRQYSRALGEYRTQLIYDNIYWIIAALIGVIAVITAFCFILKHRKKLKTVNSRR